MARIFITGGSGLIGTNAVEHFVSAGYTVLNYDMRVPQNVEHTPFWIEGDINDLQHYLRVATEFKPDYFIHLAARTDLLEKENLYQGYKSNIDGVINTIDVVNAVASIKRVLFASSRLVCKIGYLPQHDEDYCPTNLYGQSKVIGEKLVRESKLEKEWAIIRPTSIWGPWFDSPYIIMFRSLQNNVYFHPGNYNPNKSFGYVKNTVYQLDKLLQAPEKMMHKKTFYLCDYPALSLRTWSEMINQEFKGAKIKSYPLPLLKVAALIGDALQWIGWRRVPLTSVRLQNFITPMVYDTSNLEAVCGELPYDLESGVKETIEWMMTHQNRDKLALAA